MGNSLWWARQDSNLEPTDYEPLPGLCKSRPNKPEQKREDYFMAFDLSSARRGKKT